jgi:L-cysteine:1D-myo-inositol 2-amino-2-deoxy-alpha-D-glucopyranoside ligase
MSKSKGNLELVSRLRGHGVDPMAIRLALLAHHYRSDWEWTAEGLQQAEALLADLRAAADRPAGPPTGIVVDAMLSALANDLDAPAALAVLEEWAGSSDTSEPGAGAAIRRVVDAALGVALGS